MQVQWHSGQVAQAARDDYAYKSYLVSALIELCSMIDVRSISPILAEAFDQPDFWWDLQLSGAKQICDLLKPNSDLGQIKEVLGQAPPWLILRFIPARHIPTNLPLKYKFNFLQLYLPIPAIAKAALALRNADALGSSIYRDLQPGSIETDVSKPRFLVCSCTLATPMSDELADMVLRQGEQSIWAKARLERVPPLTQEKATLLPVIFYKRWEIFCREPQSVAAEISCAWAVQPPLTVSTGTLAFLEKALDRWKTIDKYQATILQTEEQIQEEFTAFANSNKTDGLRRAFVSWVTNGCRRGDVLTCCAAHGQ